MRSKQADAYTEMSARHRLAAEHFLEAAGANAARIQHSLAVRARSWQNPGNPAIDVKSDLCVINALSSRVESVQEAAMEKEVNRAVGAIVGAERDRDAGAETTSEWEAPKLRKVEIAEITANGGNVTPDGFTVS